MKYECPHCHEKTFTPLQKALCGSMRGRGKPCPKCGRRCVNGMGNIYFSSILSVVAFVAILVIYFTASERIYSSIVIGCIIAGSLLVNFVVNMFFGKLTEPIRTME